jgi:hypothetical protein
MLQALTRLRRKILATWNPADKSGDIHLTNGNLTATNTSGTIAWSLVRSTISHTTGKFYAENSNDVLNSAGLSSIFGVCDGSVAVSSTVLGNVVNSWGIQGHAYGGHVRLWNQGAVSDFGPAIAVGDSSCLYLNFAAGAGYFGTVHAGVNTWLVGNPGVGPPTFTFTPGQDLFMACGEYNLNVATLNNGQATFAGTPPAGSGNW